MASLLRFHAVTIKLEDASEHGYSGGLVNPEPSYDQKLEACESARSLAAKDMIDPYLYFER